MDKWHEHFMKQAFSVAEDLSHAVRTKVGAVAVRDRRPVCSGFNGTAPGRDNCCERKEFWDSDPSSPTFEELHWDEVLNMYPYEENGRPYRLVTKDEVLHAERNLICFAAKHGIKLDGCDLYLTHSPCKACAPMLVAAGFKMVYFRLDYRADGLDILKESGVNYQQI